MLCRNEDWVVGLTARVALKWCDKLVVFDHASSDRTSEILSEIESEYPGKLIRIREDNAVWFEMQYRQRMLDAGRAAGGTHFAIVDADEVLTNNLLPVIRDASEKLTPGLVLEAWMPACWKSLEFYRSDRSVWSRVWLSTVFKDHPTLRWETRAGYDFHHRHPFGSTIAQHRPFSNSGGVMHLQFVNRRRLKAKHALYKMTERVRWPDRETVDAVDRKYHQAIDETNVAVSSVHPTWWTGYEDLMKYIDIGDRPVWQEQECKRLMDAYGPGHFIGLNLYGVV